MQYKGARRPSKPVLPKSEGFVKDMKKGIKNVSDAIDAGRKKLLGENFKYKGRTPAKRKTGR